MRLQKAQKCEDNIESTGKHVKTQRPQAIILTYACLNICLPDWNTFIITADQTRIGGHPVFMRKPALHPISYQNKQVYIYISFIINHTSKDAARKGTEKNEK